MPSPARVSVSHVGSANESSRRRLEQQSWAGNSGQGTARRDEIVCVVLLFLDVHGEIRSARGVAIFLTVPALYLH